MTSTITGLPERYRPLDEVGPAESTPTGAVRCWRARDRILNRDVAIRVHAPGGPAAREWITRALTAGGLATPTLAMVYDAAESSGDAGAVAYVVNEWIEGHTLAERIASGGPMPDREARTVVRRLAEGVAEAHRVGLAVGGLTPETVVLRPNGLVGLRSVPAPTGTMHGDIAALGELLEYCLTGRTGALSSTGRVPGIAPDLAALVHGARSEDPATGLSSVAAMATLLADRSRPHPAELVRGADESDSGWLRRLRERHDADLAGGPRRGRPPVPSRRTAHDEEPEEDLLPLAGGFGVDPAEAADDRHDADERYAADDRYADDRYADDDPVDRTIGVGELRPAPSSPGRHAAPAAVDVPDDDVGHDRGGEDAGSVGTGRRRVVVAALLVLAVVIVVGLAWWVGRNVLSVAGTVDAPGSPSPSAAPAPPAQEEPVDQPLPGAAAPIASAAVFNPFGDGEPENEDDVGLSHDGDPTTAWSTVTYRGSAAFGNLKPGVGVLYDLGDAQQLATTTVTTTTPGVAVEVRTGDAPAGALDSYPVAAAGTVDGTTELAFEEPVTARFVLVWMTSLVPAGNGFSGDLAEVEVATAG